MLMTLKIDNQGVVNNAQIPVVYTKEDGTKVYKQPNGTFTTNADGTGDSSCKPSYCIHEQCC